MSNELSLIAFDPKAVASFGNQMLGVIVQHEEDREHAEHALRQAEEREKIIDFELTRVALFLHIEEKIDLYNIYEEDKNSSSRLYRAILMETGALVRKVDDTNDQVLYDFTDEMLKGKFEFENAIASYQFKPSEDGSTKREYTEAVVEDHKHRRSRRNALNMRLARVCKASIALFEAKATTADMQITKDEATGELQAVISKGPSEVMGKSGTVQIHSKSVSPVEGAKVTPTISGLAKHADSVHKTVSASKSKAETTDKKTPLAADFFAVINAAIMAIKSKEGKVSAQEKALLQNLVSEATTCLK
jgi:hypothetical protein